MHKDDEAAFTFPIYMAIGSSKWIAGIIVVRHFDRMGRQIYAYKGLE
jgi:hypothetical protein